MDFNTILEKLKTPHNREVISHLVDTTKQNQYVIMRLKNDQLQSIHYMTHIEGKNEFIDDRMKERKEGQILCLIKYKDFGAYLIVDKQF